MENRDLVSGLFWCGTGMIFCAGALKYGLMRSGTPIAGFFPFLAGILLICLSLVLVFDALRSKKGDGSTNGKFFSQPDSWQRIVLSLFSLFGYGIALNYAGFLITTFCLIVFLLRFVEPQRWITILTVSILGPVLSYLIFELLLDIHLPKGILGI